MGIIENVKAILSSPDIKQSRQPILLPYMPQSVQVAEAFKTISEPQQYKQNYQFKNKEVDHPSDFMRLIDLYKMYGFVTGVVDKHVDFIVGSGFYV